MISLLLNFLHILRVVSKQQILTYPGTIKLPSRLRILGWMITIIVYPIGLFKLPKDDFGMRLTDCFKKLGPVYIKFGQTLSTRPDLIGVKITNYLQSLQDKLPPFSSDIARQIIEESFGQSADELFSAFEDIPVAAASISQVHKARLKSGELVAVKILRPEIHHTYNKDIKLLYILARLVARISTKLKRLRLVAVMDVFNATMKFELDLRLEAAAASELFDNFQNDVDIYIPKIYWQLTHEYIITTEWVDGTSIYARDKLIEQGLDPAEIAQKFAIMFFNQVYRDGFFHADLHPGNILVRSDGSIVLLDFGIMGRLPDKDRMAIAESLFGFLSKNYKLVALVHLRVGYIDKNTDLDLFAQACRAVSEPIIGYAVKNISIGKLLAQLFKITEDFGMEVQPQLLLLQKTIVVVEGVGQQLDPEINMWQLIEPWIKKWAAKNLSPEAKVIRLLKYLLIEISERLCK
ncbi:2-polyprenylphenol 6-hydroxylase [Rickettsia endosymbiont of Culicoides newsteadi]|uniref:2-polyprenylphenol 6-hydroxylase n=1 Tax=Rickettsia endosymbiont of Culicoides newsteadi TaxID=1961830 RepID=UPI000B9C2C89|nr:2-polyprenylphenol 6-hydroxylase [Rickettsia endosymbiont of Culicoides newsteadi]OZG31544.1 ubiquinone biosynthesis protein UbiB [Rickettsia endosymbiont of Culicoides newsteadi]